MSEFSVSANTKTRPTDTLTLLWGFLTSGRWVALLLALFALTVILYALWPYLLVDNANSFSDAASLPVDNMGIEQGRFLSINGDLSFYGVLWLRFLLGLITFTLLLRLADRLQLVFYPKRYLSHIPSLYFGEVTYTETVQSELTGAKIEDRLKYLPYSRMTCVCQLSQGIKSFVYVGNLRSVIWGDWLLHLGCLLVIVGLFATSQLGWYDENIVLAAGESHKTGQDCGYILTLDSANAESEPGAGTVSFELATTDEATQKRSLSMFKPYLVFQLAVFQTGGGPAFRLSVLGKEGNRLPLQPLVRGAEPATSATLKFRDVQNDGYLFIPELATTIRVDRYESLPEEGYDSPVYLVRAYRGNQSAPLFSRYVEQAEEFEWQGVTYIMELENYVTLNIVSDYGWWFVLAGFLILTIGSALRLLFAPWLVCFESETEDETPPALQKVTCWVHEGSYAAPTQMVELLLQDREGVSQ